MLLVLIYFINILSFIYSVLEIGFLLKKFIKLSIRITVVILASFSGLCTHCSIY